MCAVIRRCSFLASTFLQASCSTRFTLAAGEDAFLPWAFYGVWFARGATALTATLLFLPRNAETWLIEAWVFQKAPVYRSGLSLGVLKNYMVWYLRSQEPDSMIKGVDTFDMIDCIIIESLVPTFLIIVFAFQIVLLAACAPLLLYLRNPQGFILANICTTLALQLSARDPTRFFCSVFFAA